MAASSNPATPVPAPRVDTTRPADCVESFADITSGNVNLRARALMPACAAQLLRLNNATAGALSAVLIPEQTQGGTTTITVVVNAGQQYEVAVPIKQITASGSGALSAVAYWWFHGATVPMNPA
jgi:hypothetical protein